MATGWNARALEVEIRPFHRNAAAVDPRAPSGKIAFAEHQEAAAVRVHVDRDAAIVDAADGRGRTPRGEGFVRGPTFVDDGDGPRIEWSAVRKLHRADGRNHLVAGERHHAGRDPCARERPNVLVDRVLELARCVLVTIPVGRSRRSDAAQLTPPPLIAEVERPEGLRMLSSGAVGDRQAIDHQPSLDRPAMHRERDAVLHCGKAQRDAKDVRPQGGIVELCDDPLVLGSLADRFVAQSSVGDIHSGNELMMEVHTRRGHVDGADHRSLRDVLRA